MGRRALVQILALRSWQVKHGGHLPEKLAEIVPSELDGLPDDPYKANNAFGYVRSDGLLLLPLGDFEPVESRHGSEISAHRKLLVALQRGARPAR